MASNNRLAQRRMLILLGLIGFAFSVIIFRLAYLQIIKGEELQAKALAQWTRDTIVSAQRGSITDRNGRVLAQSASAVYITAAPQNIENAEQTAAVIAQVLGIDEQTVYNRISDKSKASVTIARRVSEELAQQLKDTGLKGLYYSEDTTRVYPRGDMLSQVIGFTNVDSDGQTGLELAYNKYLAGENGHIYTEKDRSGVELTQSGSEYVAPVNGYTLVLTYDAVIQSFAEDAAQLCMQETGAKNVQCLVMDVNTGELLADVTLPSFDLNDPPRNDLDLLNDQSRNRNISDAYEPGSVFKILTASAALESGAANVNAHYYCSGSTMINGDKIRCWRSYNPHGSQDFTQALCNSCNPAFVQMALSMGRTTMYDYLTAFGLGEKTGIELSGESSGLLIAEKYVTEGDLARIGFGQSVAVTPLQMITAGCAVVNGGTLYEPHVIQKIVDGDGNVLLETSPALVSNPISAQTSATMRQALEAVVADGGGRNAYVAGYRIGGKTGTAQKYVDGVVSSEKHIGSFIGFAPIDDPQVAVLFICDEPNVRPDFGSVVAAPYAGQILKNTLEYLGVPRQYASEEERTTAQLTLGVPNVAGLTVSEAREKLESVGLGLLSDGNGIVTAQLPQAGAAVSYGSIVMVYCEQTQDENEGKVEVPDLSGMNIVKANRLLESLGLTLKIDTSSSGLAVLQSPRAGAMVEPGASVSVKFSP